MTVDLSFHMCEMDLIPATSRTEEEWKYCNTGEAYSVDITALPGFVQDFRTNKKGTFQTLKNTIAFSERPKCLQGTQRKEHLLVLRSLSSPLSHTPSLCPFGSSPEKDLKLELVLLSLLVEALK